MSPNKALYDTQMVTRTKVVGTTASAQEPGRTLGMLKGSLHHRQHNIVASLLQACNMGRASTHSRTGPNSQALGHLGKYVAVSIAWRGEEPKSRLCRRFLSLGFTRRNTSEVVASTTWIVAVGYTRIARF